MLCHKCGKEGEFYYHKGIICRPCKECKKKRVKLKHKEILQWRREYSRSKHYRQIVKNYRKRSRIQLKDWYIKHQMRFWTWDADLIELKRSQLKLFRTIHNRPYE